MSKDAWEVIGSAVVLFFIFGGAGVVSNVFSAPFRAREAEARAREAEAKARAAEAERMTFKDVRYRTETKRD